VAVESDRRVDNLPTASVRRWVTTFRDVVQLHAERLNRLNVYPVPDGDTGTNMARTLDAAVAELDGVADDDLAGTLRAVSHGSLMGARGNSGVILSQILRGFAGVVQAAGEATAGSIAAGLQAAASAAYSAVLKPIEGTILTVAREAGNAAERVAEAGGALLDVMLAARDAGRDALDRTPELLPVLKQAGVVDAGGAGYLLLLEAGLHVLDGRPLPDPGVVAEPDPAGLAGLAHRGEGDVSELRYEVMYFLDLDDRHIERFRQAWGDIGDSIVVVGGDGLWNCHVHTNDIGAAIEAALTDGGRPSQIRVTDLFEEVDEEHRAREAALHDELAGAQGRAHLSAAGLPAVTCAVVAVCVGAGLTELFGQLGVQGIVTGGQTMNPSTAELLDAVSRVNADEVVVLPNNKNIIPVAEQVDALSDKDVRVVPTRSTPEALAALVVYDPEARADENQHTMSSAARTVVTGEVTQAVRAASSTAGPVAVGWAGCHGRLDRAPPR
jgi:DAK2 domain fusion protein YloV